MDDAIKHLGVGSPARTPIPPQLADKSEIMSGNNPVRQPRDIEKPHVPRIFQLLWNTQTLSREASGMRYRHRNQALEPLRRSGRGCVGDRRSPVMPDQMRLIAAQLINDGDDIAGNGFNRVITRRGN